jgi:hypothetical protein
VSDNARGAVLRDNGQTGAFIDTFVPPKSGGLLHPAGIGFGPNGNLFASSVYANQGIYQYAGTTGAFIDLFAQPPAGATFGEFNFVFSSSVPEPPSLILLGISLAGLVAFRRRGRRRASRL